MSTTFTASNGMRVERDHGDVFINKDTPIASVFLADGTALALREFFQAERDEELGRWRWPKNPNFVVYAEDDGVHNVVNENTGLSLMATRGGVKRHDDAHADAARAYFDAHPERKPWHDAKPGEHWSLTVEGVEREYVAILSPGRDGDYVRFFPIADAKAVTLGATDPVITDGRRVGQEDES